MRAIIISIFCFFAINCYSQDFTNENANFYEYGIVEYQLNKLQGPAVAANAEVLFYNTTYKEKEFKDENNNKIQFKSFSACINYFASQGWEIFNINGYSFMMRRKISKEKAARITEECIERK